MPDNESKIERSLSGMRSAFGQQGEIEESLDRAALVLSEHFGSYQILISYFGARGQQYHSLRARERERRRPGVFVPAAEGLYIADSLIEIPLFVNHAGYAELPLDLLAYLEKEKSKSFGVVPLLRGGECVGWIECHFSRRLFKWGKEDRDEFRLIAEYCGLWLELRDRHLDAVAVSAGKEFCSSDFLRSVSDLVILRTDQELLISEALGDLEGTLGLARESVVGNPGVWTQVLHPEDLRGLGRILRRMRSAPEEINEEVRIIHQESLQQRRLMLRGVPLFASDGSYLGWEGFAVDITAKYRAEEELRDQRRRLEALYAVSRAIQVSRDPASLMLKGLAALMRATGSDAGVGCFF